jgi:hypothetical protein
MIGATTDSKAPSRSRKTRKGANAPDAACRVRHAAQMRMLTPRLASWVSDKLGLTLVQDETHYRAMGKR